MASHFIEQAHSEMLIAPVADFLGADGVGSDIVNMKDHNRIVFKVYWGVGATGINTFTVQACSNLSASATTAIAFKYRTQVMGAAPGAVTDATSAGFSNTAGSNQTLLLEVTAAAVNATGYQYVRVYADETTDSPLLGGIDAIMVEPRFAENETSVID